MAGSKSRAKASSNSPSASGGKGIMMRSPRTKKADKRGVKAKIALAQKAKIIKEKKTEMSAGFDAIETDAMGHMSNSSVFVDDEAMESDDQQSSNLKDDSDDIFASVNKKTKSNQHIGKEDSANGHTDGEETVEEMEVEETPVTPKRNVQRTSMAASPASPTVDAVARSTSRKTQASPLPASTYERPKRNRRRPKRADESGDDVVEVAKPSPRKQTKGKGRVKVEHVDHKIVVPSTFSTDVPTTPVSKSKRGGPSVKTQDVAADVKADEDDTKASPRKRVKIEGGEAKITKATSTPIKMENHDTVQESPVSGMSRHFKANRIVSSDEDEDEELDNDEDNGTEVEGGDEGSSGEDNDDNITEVETQSEDEVAIPTAVIREQVSDPANDAHRKFMDRDMIETYGGILAPPVIRAAKRIVMAGITTDKPFTKFRLAVGTVGIEPDSPWFNQLRNVTIQECFGPYLYNLARVDPYQVVYTPIPNHGFIRPKYTYSVNLSGSSYYSRDDPIAFTMFGTIVESHIMNSVVRRNGKYHRFVRIKPLTMEFCRTVNVLATLWNVDVHSAIEVSREGGGFTFVTLPSPEPYGPDWNTAPPPQPDAGESSGVESATDLPDTSIGGTIAATPSVHQAREEMKILARKGTIYNEKVPVYDLSHLVRQETLLPLNQEILNGATAWTRGEIPVGSYVCVHYIPSSFVRGGNTVVQWNLLRVVVLATT